MPRDEGDRALYAEAEIRREQLERQGLKFCRRCKTQLSESRARRWDLCEGCDHDIKHLIWSHT